MKLDLVHHAIGQTTDDSPFAQALETVREGGSIHLACPYVSLAVIEPIAAIDLDWRLLTDAEAWLDSMPLQAPAIAAFIRRHVDRVRDCRGLHAKVALGRGGALVGSANFTTRGLMQRHEFGVLLGGSAIDSVRRWYHALWDASVSPDLGRVDRRAAALAARPSGDLRAEVDRLLASCTLGPAGPPVRVRRVHVARSSPEVADNGGRGAGELAERLARFAVTRDDANTYLDLFSFAIRAAGLEEADARLAVTLPLDKVLVVNANRRELLGWRPGGLTFLVYADALPGVADLRAEGWNFGEAQPQPGPGWVRLRWMPNTVLPPAFLASWERACREASELGQRSSFRRFHQPDVCRAIVEPAARAEVLTQAFRSSAAVP